MPIARILTKYWSPCPAIPILTTDGPLSRDRGNRNRNQGDPRDVAELRRPARAGCDVPGASEQRVEKPDDRGAVRWQNRGRFFAPRGIHADVLVDAPAPLQRARAGVLRERSRLDRLRLGQRRVRDERMGEGPGGRKRYPRARRQRRV